MHKVEKTLLEHESTESVFVPGAERVSVRGARHTKLLTSRNRLLGFEDNLRSAFYGRSTTETDAGLMQPTVCRFRSNSAHLDPARPKARHLPELRHHPLGVVVEVVEVVRLHARARVQRAQNVREHALVLVAVGILVVDVRILWVVELAAVAGGVGDVDDQTNCGVSV